MTDFAHEGATGCFYAGLGKYTSYLIQLYYAFEPNLSPYRAYQDTMGLSRWSLARGIAYEDVTLSHEKIKRYLAQSESIQSLVQKSVKCLELRISEWDIMLLQDNRELFHDFYAQSSGKVWILAEKALHRFASHLKHMPRLNSMSLVLLTVPRTSPAKETAIITSMSSILCSLPTNLASLTIDSTGTPSYPFIDEPEKYVHFCSLLLHRSFMPRLRHLRVRSR